MMKKEKKSEETEEQNEEKVEAEKIEGEESEEEIKEADEEETEELNEEAEEITEGIENNLDFTIEEFPLTSQVSPILQSTPTETAGEGAENLEAATSNAPATRTETTREYIATHNEPYGGRYESSYETRDRETRDREMNVTAASLRTDLRQETSDEIKKINLQEWGRGMTDRQEQGRQDREEDYVLRTRREGEETRLPFEEKRRKRRF